MNSLQIIFNSRAVYPAYIVEAFSFFLVWYLSGLASLDYTNFIAEWAIIYASIIRSGTEQFQSRGTLAGFS